MGLLGLGSLKPAASQRPVDEMSCFLNADINSGKPKVTLIIIRKSW